LPGRLGRPKKSNARIKRIQREKVFEKGLMEGKKKTNREGKATAKAVVRRMIEEATTGRRGLGNIYLGKG